MQQDMPVDLERFDVLVKIRACSLTSRKNDYMGGVLKNVGERKSYGTDIAGIVERIGSEVTTLKVGDHVTGVIPLDYQQSGCAEYARLLEHYLVRIPASLNFVDAAAAIGDSVRAYVALFGAGCTNIRESDTVLVINGGIACSSTCIQLAHAIGAKVITTCRSTDEKIYLQTLGDRIDELIDLGTEQNFHENLYQACMKKTNNLGVDVVLDVEADQNYDGEKGIVETHGTKDRYDGCFSNHALISCLTVGGRWVTTDPALQLDPVDSTNLLLRSGSICFVNEQAWIMSSISQGKYQHMLADIVSKLVSQIIRPYVHHTVDFEELSHAVSTLSKHKIGKVALRIP